MEVSIKLTRRQFDVLFDAADFASDEDKFMCSRFDSHPRDPQHVERQKDLVAFTEMLQIIQATKRSLSHGNG